MPTAYQEVVFPWSGTQEADERRVAQAASDLSLHTIKFCFVLFGVVGHADCDKQDSLMHGSLHGKWTTAPNCYKLLLVDCHDC